MPKRIIIAIIIIALLAGGYLFVNPQSGIFTSAPWDVNGDGVVDIADLVLVSENFGETTKPPAPPGVSPELFVARVIDGDTAELSDETIVRYIGIDTPELGQPLSQEATGANRAMLEGKPVSLEYETVKKDKYGRTLAYVYTNDTFVNCELVRLGMAEIDTQKTMLKHLDVLIQCQQEAITKRRGIWVGAEDIVYITATGSKYHQQDCRYLKASAIPTTRDRAVAQGYEPCSVCKP